MKIMTKKEVEVISDIRCDVCEESCQTEGAVSNIEFGTLSAHWVMELSTMAKVTRFTCARVAFFRP